MTKFTNAFAGHGRATYGIPTVPLMAIHMADASHQGTLVTLLESGRYSFASLDQGTCAITERVLLLRILVDINDIDSGLDFDLGGELAAVSFDEEALALVGVEPEESGPYAGVEVLWDSAATEGDS